MRRRLNDGVAVSVGDKNNPPEQAGARANGLK